MDFIAVDVAIEDAVWYTDENDLKTEVIEVGISLLSFTIVVSSGILFSETSKWFCAAKSQLEV